MDTFYQVSNRVRGTVLASRLEVADSGPRRSKGLLGRNGLEAGEGLWIVPCESVHTFFMRFAIDLVYLDRKNRVRKVRSAVPPWRLSACISAHSVLELPAGTVLRTQTQTGDVLEFLPTLRDEETANLKDRNGERVRGVTSLSGAN
jgi:uncharacterized membrane protein (UPF0127 family)